MIQETTLKYFQLLANDPHHRYKSWEHNYLFFKENYKQLDNEKISDHACLHLAFYLASWGMLRGGSFLLQKDYKVHSYFIKSVVSNPKYWIFFTDEEIKKEEYIPLVEELIHQTSKVYRESVTEINGVKKSVEITDTLVSKILLGVYGNVPAYDRYFKAAVKEHGISAALGAKSLEQLFDFYGENELEFKQVADTISKDHIYPPMKLVDMYFFTEGMEKDKKAQEGNSVIEDGEKVMISERKSTNSEEGIFLDAAKGNGTIVQSVRDFIIEKLEQEKAAGVTFVDLKSGDIHRQLNFSGRLPTVCDAMNSIPSFRMEVIHQTASKKSSTNVVRYFFD